MSRTGENYEESTRIAQKGGDTGREKYSRLILTLIAGLPALGSGLTSDGHAVDDKCALCQTGHADVSVCLLSHKKPHVITSHSLVRPKNPLCSHATVCRQIRRCQCSHSQRDQPDRPRSRVPASTLTHHTPLIIAVDPKLIASRPSESATGQAVQEP